MYEFLKHIVLSVLRCPQEPPAPPAGSHQSVYVFRAAPAYLRYRLLGVWIAVIAECLVGALGIIAGVAMLQFPGGLMAAGFFLFLFLQAALAYATIRLDYEMRYYIITDRSLRIREGVWQIRETTLTFANIQNMRIEQGPIQRLFGIYDLVVETAGGGGRNETEARQSTSFHHGVFRGIQKPAELRDLIMRCLRALRTSGLGDLDDLEQAAFGAVPGAGQEAAAATSPDGPQTLAVLREIAEETARWRGQFAAR